MVSTLDFLQNGTLLSSQPGKVLIGWGKRTWIALPTHLSSTSTPLFYFPDYFLKDPTPCFTHAHTMEISYEELFSLLNTSPQQHLKPLSSMDWHFPLSQNIKEAKTFFYETLESLKTLFSQTVLEKVVPYMFQAGSLPMTQERLRGCLIQALKKVQSRPLFLYGFWDFPFQERQRKKEPVGKSLGILGATPELLIALESPNLLQTAAVAGTFPASRKLFLLEDAKERREHQLVIDGIVETLSFFGEVSKEATKIVDLGSLSHLKTAITLDLPSFFSSTSTLFLPALLNIIAALHPTPALGGFPKEEALEWLKKYAVQIPRGRFGAPVGFFSSDRAASYVAIRNVQWEGEEMCMGAGCGIVKESEKKAEWDEIMLKLSTIKDFFGL